MKTHVLWPLMGVVLGGIPALSLAAEASGPWGGYVTYAPQPIVTSVGVHDAEWMWLSQFAGLLPEGGYTFLARKDADHWMGFTDFGSWWRLQIHDETSRFNFRARIDAKTGRITVERGVDWKDSDRDADARQAAMLAVGYLERARTSEGLFGPEPSPMPPMAQTHDGTPASAEAHATSHLPVEAWTNLLEGNQRFVSGKVLHPHQSMARIEETARGQKPFAIVVSCSDSRVPPEVLFDQGIGDLFVVRTAGEVVTDVELGSIEYAVEHLGATFLVVLGHEKCGAVDATLKGGDLPPNIEAIAAQIRPAIQAAQFFKGDVLDNAVRENAKTVLAKIKDTPSLAEALRSGHLNVQAAYYDLDTGKVSALP